jgi:hypothetical protein
MQREVKEAPPSFILGIPEPYVYETKSTLLYSPNDIWKLRYLK